MTPFEVTDCALLIRSSGLPPYSMGGTEELRAATLEIIDDRLGELTMVPWVRPGDEFLFKEATTVVFDTGERIRHPRELAPALRRMTTGGIYYHFLEALRRTPMGKDDFSAWLLGAGKEYELSLRSLGSIDYHFHSLALLRKELVRALTQMEDAR